jgi:hypothetical protein
MRFPGEERRKEGEREKRGGKTIQNLHLLFLSILPAKSYLLMGPPTACDSTTTLMTFVGKVERTSLCTSRNVPHTWIL